MIRHLMVHFSVVSIPISAFAFKTFPSFHLILQMRPMATRQRREYGPSACSIWTELRRSRTFSRTKKNRGRNLSKSHRAMTSMWSAMYFLLRKHCLMPLTDLCVCVRVSRSDSDSEGENPEKKKLQEQLMGKAEKACARQSLTD